MPVIAADALLRKLKPAAALKPLVGCACKQSGRKLPALFNSPAHRKMTIINRTDYVLQLRTLYLLLTILLFFLHNMRFLE